jgi:hypothetical protein
VTEFDSVCRLHRAREPSSVVGREDACVCGLRGAVSCKRPRCGGAKYVMVRKRRAQLVPKRVSSFWRLSFFCASLSLPPLGLFPEKIPEISTTSLPHDRKPHTHVRPGYQPTRRLLYRNMSAAARWSASARACWSPYMVFRRAKTRSHDAEFGDNANATRAASAYAGKEAPLTRHHLRRFSVKSATSDVSKMGAPGRHTQSHLSHRLRWEVGWLAGRWGGWRCVCGHLRKREVICML